MFFIIFKVSRNDTRFNTYLNIIDSTLCVIVALVHPNTRPCVYLFCNQHNILSLVVQSN
jgi:hypothetical protein